ncbi:primosomal protein N' [Pseudomaricurvus alkylphenolicus]|jgi:primosomal protein N' (replication factor Y)|nr:primosomal protein N' [Pseudomaricurvus alkylphenolicus]NIB39351.1 primosomal protein N' [Pseudomaricurvus alkylphenolicus]
MSTAGVVAVALPTPLRRTFDYLLPDGVAVPEPGTRVAVKFGNQQLLGIVIETRSDSELPIEKLRPLDSVLDKTPLLPQELLQLCKWSSDYYHHPLGEVLATAIPTALRQGEAAHLQREKAWRLTPQGRECAPDKLKRAPKQLALWRQLSVLGPDQHLLHKDLLLQEISRSALKGLEDKGLTEAVEVDPVPLASPKLLAEPPLQLNCEQADALENIASTQFATYLLYGTTGSGKTEVYLQAIAKALEQGKQALVLIPEIGLTPQTLSRFRRRFHRPMAVMHSGLSDSERKQAWLLAANGQADIIIGTRSAIFTPLPKAGIVILDEEHDSSFKQQDGFRYSARDLAAVRCHRLGIPLVLGSATPSLESYYNAHQQRYRLLTLTTRAGEAKAPEIELIDLKRQPLQDGMTQALLDQVQLHLQSGNQVLVFLNRRGFAPTLMCHDCGWISQCPACDARLTVHQTPSHLHCHHCDYQRPLISQCPNCQSLELHCVGQGTERTEMTLQQTFEDYAVIRVDRDTTRRKDAMQNIVDKVNEGEPCILVGTQMLAKGHHFPNVTLVAILDADGGLFSTDFRGPEKMGQLLLQVSGRAGRAHKPGKVLIQSHLCDHPLLQTLLRQGYSAYANLLLQERQVAQLPPLRPMVLLRAESKRAENAFQFLDWARRAAEQLHPSSPELQYLGPLPAPMEKRNQRYRYQLQISANQRGRLHHLLKPLLEQLDQAPLARRCRWSVDVDPQDMT